jgi:pimeloyl-ACP methyl ester carboxylesterase
VLAGIFIAEPSAAEVAAFTTAQRAWSSAGVAADMLEVDCGTDVRAELPQIRARTLVLHREADPATRFQLGQEVAALIPDAAFVPLPGTRLRS